MILNRHEVLGEISGPGCIRRIWVTGRGIGRELILRIYFDDEPMPYVEAPLSDFFGIMHNRSESNRDGEFPDREPYRINTPYLASKPHNGFTCYFPMPFARSARIEVTNEADTPSRFYYIIDWHEYPDGELLESMRFSARWRREAPVRDYQDDFLILDADGPGRLIGFVHSIDMLHDRHVMRWSHAGSDNIYIDGLGPYPSYLRGIGGEDTFGTSYGGHCYEPQSALFSDMPYYEQKNADNDALQRLVGYRFFVNERIDFAESIQFRYGARAHDISATVYWYSDVPVRPYVSIPPYQQRLPGSRPGRAYDLPRQQTGQWWICGPFPSAFNEALPSCDPFDPNGLFAGRMWRHRASQSGFIDFNHTFRPIPSNQNSVTLINAAAVARCELHAPNTCFATFTFGWDDRLIFRLNDASNIDMGENPYFQSKSVQVRLRKGKNSLAVLLDNTIGLTTGGWSFSFGAVTDEGVQLMPQAECASTQLIGENVLSLDFGPGSSEPQQGFRPFVPPYSEELGARILGSSVDVICSPQTELFCTPLGPISVTVAASDNTSMGFRERECVTEGPWAGHSALIRSEVRANAHPDGESVSLTIQISELPAGDYDLTSYHHCHSDDEDLGPVDILLDGEHPRRDALKQTTGINPREVECVTLRIRGGKPIRVVYEANSAVVLNGLSIALVSTEHV